ncbi:MAG: hypothetical protein M3126_03105 [Candidatus Eremiobacteraeota bacterium]|nr:hypothetical protein [Candidatus Eremiobacteraeota bacterium]
MKSAPEGFMHVSMRAGSALLTAILLGAAASASTKGAGRRFSATTAPVRSLEMYSLRARRRAALILQMELLELRKARLERVREVIQKRLPIDFLLRP